MCKQIIKCREELQRVTKLITTEELLKLSQLGKDYPCNFNLNQQSKTVERMLLDLDLPVIYFDSIGEYNTFYNGEDIITTLARFKGGELMLQNLQILTEFNGKSYIGLSNGMREKFLKYRFSVAMFNNEIPIKYAGYLVLAYNEVELQTLRESLKEWNI